MIYAHEQAESRAVYRGPRPDFPLEDKGLLNQMHEYLEGRNLPMKLATRNGWYPADYRDAPRIIIPCSNSLGLPYWQGRDMSGKSPIRYASPSAPRDDSIVICWPSGKMAGCVIVEGPMDALAAASVGFLGLGVMGNQLNADVVDHIARYARGFKCAFVLPDTDAPYFGAAMVAQLAQRGLSVRALEPRLKDLAATPPSQRKSLLHGEQNER